MKFINEDHLKSKILSIAVGMERLELSRHCCHMALNHACLPISPHPQLGTRNSFSRNLGLIVRDSYEL